MHIWSWAPKWRVIVETRESDGVNWRTSVTEARGNKSQISQRMEPAGLGRTVVSTVVQLCTTAIPALLCMRPVPGPASESATVSHEVIIIKGWIGISRCTFPPFLAPLEMRQLWNGLFNRTRETPPQGGTTEDQPNIFQRRNRRSRSMMLPQVLDHVGALSGQPGPSTHPGSDSGDHQGQDRGPQNAGNDENARSKSMTIFQGLGFRDREPQNAGNDENVRSKGIFQCSSYTAVHIDLHC